MSDAEPYEKPHPKRHASKYFSLVFLRITKEYLDGKPFLYPIAVKGLQDIFVRKRR